mmetsp:Transcript_23069/g.49996  ORF Transcript_23069/g.49996 Transcript_23069/m.49996 type:complete len:102 (+) Transcript_23069:322-627(+)
MRPNLLPPTEAKADDALDNVLVVTPLCGSADGAKASMPRANMPLSLLVEEDEIEAAAVAADTMSTEMEGRRISLRKKANRYVVQKTSPPLRTNGRYHSGYE